MVEEYVKKEYKLRGLSFPLKSGLNSVLEIENYFSAKDSLSPEDEITLKKHYPVFLS